MILGQKIIRYPEVDSTNEEARRLIKQGSGEGLVVIADRQTQGRGKPGHHWFSPQGNLYLSVVLEPYKNQQELAPITLIGALAARAMIDQLAQLPVVVKWPNDLRVRGKKIGGILTERLSTGQVIIGLGLNINAEQSVFPAELRQGATSLRIETGRQFELAKCVSVLLDRLDETYRFFLDRS